MSNILSFEKEEKLP